MAYLALYRKYRSQSFDDLIGQEHVVRTLQNGIRQGRIAHAYLFTGPRGTGKTSTARLLAKALCCDKGPTPEPCNECEICRAIMLGDCMDVVEMDAASESGVDDIRESIVNVAAYSPAMARYKVFIIDEVHDLSAKAFDALLKTIEEPPAHLIFVLATTEYSKVPATIRSRCQKFEFHRGATHDLVGRLEFVIRAEGMEADPDAVLAIARMADGGYRDALTLLEQVSMTGEGKITIDRVRDQLGLIPDDVVDALLLAIKSGDVAGILKVVDDVARRGRDPRSLVEGCLHRLAELTRAALGVDAAQGAQTMDATLHSIAAQIGSDNLLALRGELAVAHAEIRDISLPRIWLESELIRISQFRNRPATALPPLPAPEAKTPRAEPAPKPQQSATQLPAAQEPVSRPAASGSDWENIRTKLVAVSKTLGMRIASATGERVDTSVYEITFARELDRDWVAEKPKVRDHVVQVVQEVLGAPVTVEFLTKGASRPTTAAPTVEPVLEGEKLREAAREILSQPRTESPQPTEGPDQSE